MVKNAKRTGELREVSLSGLVRLGIDVSSSDLSLKEKEQLRAGLTDQGLVTQIQPHWGHGRSCQGLTFPLSGYQGSRAEGSQVSHTQVLVAQSYQTLRDPMDCSPPGSSVLGIFQAGILEWAAISFSRGSSVAKVKSK